MLQGRLHPPKMHTEPSYYVKYICLPKPEEERGWDKAFLPTGREGGAGALSELQPRCLVQLNQLVESWDQKSFSE